MHGAKAIMSAEPPSRQDLKQNPTIIVQVPQATDGQVEKERNTKKSKGEKKKETINASPPLNPYSIPGEPPIQSGNPSPGESHLLQKDGVLQGSIQSLSSTEHDTYL